MDKELYWTNKLNTIKQKNPYLILDKAKEYHKSNEKIELGCPKHNETYWFKIKVNHILSSKITCPLCSGKDKSNIKQEIERKFPNFDFSKFEYINAYTPFIIICKECGYNWNIAYTNIKNKNSCPNCKNTAHLKNNEWINKATKLRGDLYDYSESEYINNYTPVKIFCKKCNNYFFQNPYNNLIRKNNCPCYNKNTKYTKESFISKASLIHNNKYDYSKVNYINNKTKVEIICNKHGNFEQTPASHLSGNGCPSCIKNTTETFINKAKLIHGNKYNYSLVNYINSYTKVKIICNKHGIFEQTPSGHLRNGCPKCSINHRLSTEEFVERSKASHSIKYDYSLVNYINKETPVRIICPIHGEFIQRAGTHIKGSNCPKCANIITKSKTIIVSKTTEQFIKEAIDLHGNTYDYSLVKYKNKNTPVKIICSKHGVFEQRPRIHLSGSGCPTCNKSKGEKLIKSILLEKNVIFETQKKFSDLRDVLPLSYDFYIPSKKLLIEYNGEQHYNYKSFNKNYNDFLLQKHHDWLKRKYALKNNYNLLIINYNEDIKEKLLKVNLYD